MSGSARVGTLRLAGFVLLWVFGIQPHRAPSVWLGVVAAVMLLVLAHVVTRALRLGGLGGIGLKPHAGSARSVGVGFLAGVAVVLLYVAAALGAGRYAAVGFRPIGEVGASALMIVLSTAYTGLWEEVLCRDYLLRAVPRRLGTGALLLVSAVVFVLFHFNRFGSAPDFFLPYWFLSGIAYAIPLLATGSLWTSIGLHCGHNLLYLLLLVREGWMVAERGADSGRAIRSFC